MDYTKIITIEPGKRGGRPCIRGMRISVYDIAGWFAAGMSETEIIDDFPELTSQDIRAAMTYVASGQGGPASSAAEIKAAIAQLPPPELPELSAWLVEYHHDEWDKQIEDDLASGRLDGLLAEVDNEIKAGLAKPM